jgi:multiple antibiotic resistance protein
MIAFFNDFDVYEIFKTATVLFAVIDIVGSVPMIIKIKEQTGDIHPIRTSLVSLGIMIGFFILGESILQLFGVDVRSFAVAGSIIIFAMSLEMILGIRLFRFRKNCECRSACLPNNSRCRNNDNYHCLAC